MITTSTKRSQCCRAALAFEQIAGMLVYRVVNGQKRYAARCMSCGKSTFTTRHP